MRLAPLAALAASIACADAPPPPVAAGPPAEFAVDPPEVEAPGGDLITGEGPDLAELDAPDDIGQPLVDSGIWTMRVVEASGDECAIGAAPGELVDVLVEGGAHSVRIMDLVTLFSEGDGRAAGVGIEGGEIAEGCSQTDAVFATAALHGPDRFEAWVEHARTYTGDGCGALKDAPKGCSGAFLGRFEWAEPLDEDTGTP